MMVLNAGSHLGPSEANDVEGAELKKVFFCVDEIYGQIIRSDSDDLQHIQILL